MKGEEEVREKENVEEALKEEKRRHLPASHPWGQT